MWHGLGLLVAYVLVLGGCAGNKKTEQLIVDSDQPQWLRQRAIDQVSIESSQDEIQALLTVVGSSDESHAMRVWAWQRCLTLVPDQARQYLQQHWGAIDSVVLRRRFLIDAACRHWGEFGPALISIWPGWQESHVFLHEDWQQGLEGQLEQLNLAELSGSQVWSVLLEAMSQMPADQALLLVCTRQADWAQLTDATVCAIAWAWFVKECGQDKAQQQLMTAWTVSSDLQRENWPSWLMLLAHEYWLETWPQTREQVALWLLTGGLTPEQVMSGQASLSQMNSSQMQPPVDGLAMRHAALMQTDGLASYETGQAWHRWAMIYAQRVWGDLNIRSNDWVDPSVWHALSQADQLAVVCLHQALQNPNLVDSLFKQADLDFEDMKTEHGGLLEIEYFSMPGTKADSYQLNLKANAWPVDANVLRMDDMRYTPPATMLVDLPKAFAHYHFHAQSHTNDLYAEPSDADWRFVERYGCQGVVFTFLNRSQLAVDWYIPGGIAFRLAVLNRP